MAVIYCRSTDGADGDDGSTWALAKATLAAAVTAAGTGGTVYVADGHAENLATGNMTIDSSVNNYGSPVKILCVDDTGDPEPPTALAAGAIVEISDTASRRIEFKGCMYIYGIEFRTRNSSVSHTHLLAADLLAGSILQVFDNCTLNNRSTGSSANITIGSTSTTAWARRVIWKDCTITTSNSSGNYTLSAVNSELVWIGGSLGSWADGHVVYNSGGVRPSRIFIRDVDMSVLGSGQYVVNVPYRNQTSFDIANCKIGASAGLVESFTAAGNLTELSIINVSNSDVDIQFLIQNAFGVYQEDLTIYRSGGASDGTTSFSAKVVTTSYCEELVYSFRVKLADVWADTSSTATFTTHIVHDSATNLQDDEVWLEVEYQDDTTTLCFNEDDRAADIFATPADQTASTETWTGTGGFTNENKQKLAVTTTNTGKAGPCTVWLNVAKPSKTLYICPKIGVT